MFIEAIERCDGNMEAMRLAFMGMKLCARQPSGDFLAEELEYPQEGTLDELDAAVDRGLLTNEQAEELEAILRERS